MHAVKEERPLVGFFALCFLISWGLWIPAGLLAPEQTALVLPGAWSPTLAALVLTWRSGGRGAVRELLRGLVAWRVKPRYYLFAVFSPLGLLLIALALDRLLGGSPPNLEAISSRFGLPPDQPAMLLAAAPVIFLTSIFVGGPIAEELGWRGYAQPRLQERIGGGAAGLSIGFIWGLWHLPMFYFFPAVVGNLPLGPYILLVSGFSVLFAWIYNRTGGSVLLCVLLHAGVNFGLGIAGAGLIAESPRLLTIYLILLGGLAATLYPRAGSR